MTENLESEYNLCIRANLLDRLPTAKIIKEDKNVVLVTAETFGDGIYMWLKSQGDLVEIMD